MLYDELTPDQQAKLGACTSPEEILNLAKAEGRELSDDELEMVAGGGGMWSSDKPCPDCGAVPTYVDGVGIRHCTSCGKIGGF